MMTLLLFAILSADAGTPAPESARPPILLERPPTQGKFNPAKPESTNSFAGCREVVVLRANGKHIKLPCENGEIHFFVEWGER